MFKNKIKTFFNRPLCPGYYIIGIHIILLYVHSYYRYNTIKLSIVYCSSLLRVYVIDNYYLQ